MTQDEIMEMARQAGFVVTYIGDPIGTNYAMIEAFARLVAAKEREACAEICDSFYLSWIDVQGRYEFMGEGASECAGAIRARGEQA